MKRQRTATESLLSITLALEACLVFFAALAAFALDAVSPVVALVGGLVLIVLFALGARLVRHDYGVWFGWLLQAVLIGTGVVLPIMYIIGAGFLALWIYCFIKGRSLDRISTGSIPETNNKETP